MRSRRPRDDEGEDVEVTVADWQNVEVRDSVSSKDCVWNIVIQLGFTSATGRHGATTPQLPDFERLDRRQRDDDVTDGDADDVTLSGQQIQ